MAAVKLHNKWGYINRKGEFIIKPRYDWTCNFNNGLALVLTGDEAKIWGRKDEEHYSDLENFKTMLLYNTETAMSYINKKGQTVYKENRKPVSISVSTDIDVINNGKLIYNKYCTPCHKQGGAGSIGPNLTDDYWIYGCDDITIYKIIKKGTPKGMPPWKTGADNILKVMSYIYSLRGTKPANPKQPEGKFCKWK